MSLIPQCLRGIDWTFLFACISWGLTTALMLYVKLRKKSESFPVLILVGVFLLYMNAGDLFKSFRLYTIACVNRRLLAHQFIAMAVFGFVSNSYSDVVVLVLLMLAVIGRTNWESGKSGIPVIGPFLVSPLRRTIVALSLASQCFGFVTGIVLSAAMIDDSRAGSSVAEASLPTDPALYRVASAFGIVLLASQLIDRKIPMSAVRGRVQTFLGSGLVAAVSRVVPFYSLPFVMVPVVASVSHLLPGCVTSVSTFIPQIARVRGPMKYKLHVFASVAVWHVAGALLSGYLSDYVLDLPSTTPPFVSKKTIGQEFIFSALIGFIGTQGSRLTHVVMLAAWLATAGADAVHLSSSISFGADALSDGRLLARLIWQIAGSLVGATLVSAFADSDKIDFDPITSVTRSTDGRVVNDGSSRPRVAGK